MWPLSARIQPFSDRTTVIGSFSIMACPTSTAIVGASANGCGGARAVSGRMLARLLDLAGDLLPLQLVRLQELVQFAPLLGELVVLGLISISSSFDNDASA